MNNKTRGFTASLRSARAISERSNGAYIFFISAVVVVSVFLFAALFLVSSSSSSITDSVDFNRGVASLAYNGGQSIRRSVLAVKSDPLKPRVDQIRKQADDHRSLALAYACFARKLKLENSKIVRVFVDLVHNYTDPMSKPSYRSMFDFDDVSIDESQLHQFEKELKERIRITRQVISDSKESFDNQLKIQKLKDTIFAVNEHLTKAKKQGAFASLIAAKSIPKSIHCVTGDFF